QPTVLPDILLGSEALSATALCLSFAARLDKIGEADDFSANETFLDVGVNGPRRFPGGQAFANRPGAIFFAADGQKGEVTAFVKRPEKQCFRMLKFLTRANHDGFIGVEIVGGNGLEFIGSQAGVEEEALGFKQGLYLLESVAFGRLGIPSQSCLHELKVLENQVCLGIDGGQEGV